MSGNSPAGAYQGQPIGYGSAVVNGQLINVAPLAAFDPLVFAGAYSGPGWPRQGVYDVPPVIPSSAVADYAWSNPTGASSGMPTATDSSGNPFHLTKSPVVWAVLGLAAALLYLHFVVYK